MGQFSKIKMGLLGLGFLALTGCDDDDDGVINVVSETFTVRIENMSTEGLLETERAGGAVPLSPGVYAVYEGDDPMFTVGQAASAGLELIAEDGETAEAFTALQNMAGVIAGFFDAPGGPDNGPAILPGEVATFTFDASPGDKLQIATMFVQSNDWFYAFGDNGLDLFDGLDAIEGDVTSELILYDAGTEADTAPGTGPDQKPAQDPGVIDQGPDDDVNQVQAASTRHATFTIPATSAVIRVTISHQ